MVRMFLSTYPRKMVSTADVSPLVTSTFLFYFENALKTHDELLILNLHYSDSTTCRYKMKDRTV